MKPPIRVIGPIQEFFEKESTGGIILMIAAIVAMIWANSPWSHQYFELLHHHINITFGENIFSLNKPVELWINDFLMAIFFFVIGLEIKREVMAGELSDIRAASLPIAAAVGGMIVPAGLYALLNVGGSMSGWAIPMATDIAFALGLLTLMGKRVPLSLKIFLTALAIVDDLSGVIVIALFYTEQINAISLLSAASIFAVLMILNYLKVYKMAFYGVLGLTLWLFVYESGLHPTIAGVLLAISIPSKRRVESFSAFKEKLNQGMLILKQNPIAGDQHFLTPKQAYGIDHIYTTSKYTMSPVQRLEHQLHPFVAFFVLPMFALANAGIPLQGDLTASIFSNVSLGIIAGLFLGKQIGITLFVWLAVKFKLGVLPSDLNWRMIHGLSCIAGIGFTMSFFIGNLAFDNPETILQSKIGIVVASILSGTFGWIMVSRATKQ